MGSDADVGRDGEGLCVGVCVLEKEWERGCMCVCLRAEEWGRETVCDGERERKSFKHSHML